MVRLLVILWSGSHLTSFDYEREGVDCGVSCTSWRQCGSADTGSGAAYQVRGGKGEEEGGNGWRRGGGEGRGLALREGGRGRDVERVGGDPWCFQASFPAAVLPSFAAFKPCVPDPSLCSPSPPAHDFYLFDPSTCCCVPPPPPQGLLSYA